MRRPITPLLVALTLVLAACGGADGASDVESFHPTDKGWTLVWSDEFEGSALDTSKWAYEKNCWGGGNEELQCYTDAATNVELRDGLLHINAREESSTGLAVSEDSSDAASAGTKTLPYTSGRIRTKNLAEWTYGRFEIRARLPHGQGLWPAAWMLPTDSPYGGWAAGGEIDIMEAVNLKVGTDLDSRSVHGTLHYGGEWPDNRSSGALFPFREGNPADSFHVYAMEWEEGEIRWYVDGAHYATQTSDGWFTNTEGGDGSPTTAPDAAPFDQPFHLILNVAVGGTWPGAPDDTTQLPQVMEVDYVRVYECSASPADGKGCETEAASAQLVRGG